jgi:hypothetical protein
MASKRRSLAELIREDDAVSTEAAPAAVVEVVPEPKAPVAPVVLPTAAEKVIPKAETRNPKSDFIKMSVTVPPDMFDALQDISRARRRAKQPYTMSDLVREAVGHWLESTPETK